MTEWSSTLPLLEKVSSGKFTVSFKSILFLVEIEQASCFKAPMSELLGVVILVCWSVGQSVRPLENFANFTQSF